MILLVRVGPSITAPPNKRSRPTLGRMYKGLRYACHLPSVGSAFLNFMFNGYAIVIYIVVSFRFHVLRIIVTPSMGLKIIHELCFIIIIHIIIMFIQ